MDMKLVNGAVKVKIRIDKINGKNPRKQRDLNHDLWLMVRDMTSEEYRKYQIRIR